jgi:hypothetical protein
MGGSIKGTYIALEGPGIRWWRAPCDVRSVALKSLAGLALLNPLRYYRSYCELGLLQSEVDTCTPKGAFILNSKGLLFKVADQEHISHSELFRLTPELMS